MTNRRQPNSQRASGPGRDRRSPPGTPHRRLRGDRAGCLHGVARSLDRERRLPGPAAVLPSRSEGSPGLGDHRLQHRVRLLAGHRGPQLPTASGAGGMFFAGLAVFTLGSALCGLAPSVDLLVAGRVIQGCGAACLLPASLGLLLGAFPVRATLAGRGPVGRSRRAGGRHRSLARRRDRLRRRVAVGVLRQPARGCGGLAGGPTGPGPTRGPNAARGTPDYSGCRAGEHSSGGSRPGDLGGIRPGAGRAGGSSPASQARSSWAQPSCTGRPTTRSPCWT